MVFLDRRIDALRKLGEWLMEYVEFKRDEMNYGYGVLDNAVKKAFTFNPWWIDSFIYIVIKSWAVKLSDINKNELLDKYTGIENPNNCIDVAVITRSEVPLSGLHDFICVILTGNRFFCRNINHENDILQLITLKLLELEPGFKDNVFWTDHLPKGIDSFLLFSNEGDTTLLNYFGSKNNLIRKKRISAGVLLESDNEYDYRKFADDIFNCFGLSNRNVRKLLVPENFTVDAFYPSIEHYGYLYKYNRYANNFDYNRSIFLLDKIPFFENGFLIMRECSELKVPAGCVYFEYYYSHKDLEDKLKLNENEYQQIITNSELIPGSFKPGSSFDFSLFNYDDNKDVIRFLLELTIN